MPEVERIEKAVILAAGWGSRVQGLADGDDPVSKPLIEIDGTPILLRIMNTMREAGIRSFVVVTGYLHEIVEETVRKWASENAVSAETVYNTNWSDLANGVSLLAAREHVRAPFLLSMADHVFDVRSASDVLDDGLKDRAVRLCIDRKIDTIFDIDDATKVLTRGENIEKIGKTLSEYNAIDIGLFVCLPELFDALASVRSEKGDCSLSDGMQVLGERGRFGYFDIGERLWQDVDTPETLDYALKLIADGKIRFA